MEEEGSGTDVKGHDEGYFDDEEGGTEEEDMTNSRDVGHNIYILAHQVCSNTDMFLQSFCYS